MPNFRNHRVNCEVSSSFQAAGELELDVLHSQRAVDTTTRVHGKHILVDDIEYSAYNNELKRKRKRKLIFILLITVGTAVLLVMVAAIPLLLASRTAIRNDTGGRGGTKTVMGDNMSTKCEPLSHSLENGYIVCDGENVNSTCWTVCLEGYKKEDLLMGSYNCQVNGEWSGEHTTCTPKDCGTPSQNTTTKEVQQCSKPSGICQLPIKNGMLYCSGTSYKHSCKVTCDEQFRRNLSYIVCESVGKWNRIDFGCLPEDPCINSLCNTINGSCIPVSDTHRAWCRCKMGFAGNGIHCQTDSDLDGFPDAKLPCQEKHCQMDNCPLIPNSGQENNDGDQMGDICDDDDDNDNATDTFDNCPFNLNPGQDDKDNDTVGDACDNCLSVHNTDQSDTDHDGIGNACEPQGDMDNDGISAKEGDNCPLMPNSRQQDSDGDGVGDLCDNCVNVFNVKQNDRDQNLIGDVCDEQVDQDQDGVSDNRDNCQTIPNGDQLDCDADKIGDACDSDKDGDGVTDDQDNCPFVSNLDQADIDEDGIGDACVGDTDGDMVTDYEDDYPLNKFLNRTDFTLYQEVILDDEGEAQVPPKWVVFRRGQEVVQTANGNPGLILSYTQFGHLDYSGTVYISDAKDDDFVGIVFSYQSNRHFYVCSWKKKTQTYNLPGLPYPRSVGRKGINLMAIDSITGPGVSLRDALWETGNTINQTHVLWYDPGPQWITGVAYRWRLLHDPDSGRIRVRWYERTKLISDSGNIIDKRYCGGRVGMYVFSQMGVYYSALQALYPKVTNFALNFGVNAYADLGAFSDILGQISSFTLAAWVWITGADGPVICSLPPVDFGYQTSNLGFLLQSVEDEEDWTLTSTTTPTRGTGPTADHTSGSGIYAYLESSGIARGNRASLDTPWFSTGKGCNLSFFYHMYDGSHAGIDMGTLGVEVRTEKQAWFLVFWRGGNQGKSWHKGYVDLSVYKGLVAVRFTAAKGRSYHSDIAIDDVSFSSSCSAASACTSSEVLPVFGTEEGKAIHLSVSGGRVQGATGQSQPIKGNLPFMYNSWTHCAIQYNSETKQQSLYVNGRLDQVFNHAFFSPMPRFNLLLGRDGSKNFQGLLDEVQIWNTAVNVPVLYNKPLARNEKGLVTYYKCNDGEGNTLEDSGPLKKHGSLHGAKFLSSSLELGKQE